MTEVLSNSTTDKVSALVKEAEALKAKLEEERQKLNDVTCKLQIFFQLGCFFFNETSLQYLLLLND